MSKPESEKAYVQASELWPIGVRDLSTTVLRELDDAQFQELKRKVYARELERTGSPTRARALVRSLSHKRTPISVPNIPRFLLPRKRRDAEIMDALVKGRERKWIPPLKRRPTQPISLENFSFIDNPIETLRMLSEIAEHECVSSESRVHYDDAIVKDIGPYLLLAIMYEYMVPFIKGGRMAIPIQKVMEAVGLRRAMGISYKALQDITDVHSFQLKRRRKANRSHSSNIAFQPTTFEKVADDLVKSVNDWLDKLPDPLELTEFGRQNLNVVAAEILNNAERHSRVEGDGDWITAGFMAKRTAADTKDGFIHVCHLSFVSFGLSISESMAHCGPKTRILLEEYTRRHAKRSAAAEERLNTVFAIQDGNSRLLDQTSGEKGGVGMMEMVEMANDLGATESADFPPEICIISGQTCVFFKGKYNSYDVDPATKRRLQYFNEANNPQYPPDSTHVFSVEPKFPGTVISMRFAIDEHIETETET